MVTTNAIVSRGAKRRRRATAVIVPPTFVRVIGKWQGSRLASAREMSASLPMPTGSTGSAAIASAMALSARGPAS
jgi:hypothetical protein